MSRDVEIIDRKTVATVGTDEQNTGYLEGVRSASGQNCSPHQAQSSMRGPKWSRRRLNSATLLPVSLNLGVETRRETISFASHNRAQRDARHEHEAESGLVRGLIGVCYNVRQGDQPAFSASTEGLRRKQRGFLAHERSLLHGRRAPSLGTSQFHQTTPD